MQANRRAAAGVAEHPDQAEFYTSGRASNEAAFLYQLFARAFGTNNFPDCSNMCHEATSVGLPQSIGVGKGTVTLEDFDHRRRHLLHRPQPRHQPSAHADHAARRVPARRADHRGQPACGSGGSSGSPAPQDPVEMLTLTARHRWPRPTIQLKVGGDAAMLKGMMKALLAADETSRAAVATACSTGAFIAEHTTGFEALVADLAATSWAAIEARSGLARAQIERWPRSTGARSG